MKNDTDKLQEEKANASKQSNETKKAEENKEQAEHKETMAERAEREGWTDTAASHLGIDE